MAGVFRRVAVEVLDGRFGRMFVWDRGFVVGVSGDVGADAEAAGSVPVHGRVLRAARRAELDLRAAASGVSPAVS